jgi:hypothetical protein
VALHAFREILGAVESQVQHLTFQAVASRLQILNHAIPAV